MVTPRCSSGLGGGGIWGMGETLGAAQANAELEWGGEVWGSGYIVGDTRGLSGRSYRDAGVQPRPPHRPSLLLLFTEPAAQTIPDDQTSLECLGNSMGVCDICCEVSLEELKQRPASLKAPIINYHLLSHWLLEICREEEKTTCRDHALVTRQCTGQFSAWYASRQESLTSDAMTIRAAW